MGISLAKYGKSIAELVREGEISSEFAEAYSALSEDGKIVLWAIMDHIGGERSLSNKEIASATKLPLRSVQRVRSEPRFGRALSAASHSEICGEAELGMMSLRKKVMEKNVPAIKIWLEITGVYSPVTRIESKQMQVRMDAAKMPSEVKRDVVERWKGMGWTKDEFIELWDIISG